MPQLPMGDIGAAEIVWDNGGLNEISLSPHYGSVNLSGDETINPVEEEDFGDAPVDGVRGGLKLLLTVPMARSTLEQLAVILGGTVDGDEIEIPNLAGQAMREDAKEIAIKRRLDGSPDETSSQWVILYHCSYRRAFELVYDRSSQKIFNVEFWVFVSQVSGQVGKFGKVGKN